MRAFVLTSVLAVADAAQYVKGTCGNDSGYHYDIYAPETEGTYPVMVYVTGLDGVAPGSGYSGLSELLADKGIVVTMLSREAAPRPQLGAQLESKALDWLQDAYSTLNLTASADFDKLVLSGHSAGNHVTCDFLADSCGNQKAKGVVMMDPVDGQDPLGVVKNFCITPGQKLNFSIPALLVRTGLDPAKKHGLACAPDKLSNQRFFNAWSGPIWMANATKYAHLDVMNAGVGKMGTVVCAADDEPRDIYQEHIANLTGFFLKTIFDGDASAEAKLNDASWMQVDVELQKDYNGHAAPFKAGCTQKPVVV